MHLPRFPSRGNGVPTVRREPRTPKLYGPFQLTEERIDENVVPDSAGVYGVGYSRANTFVLAYLGRSDADLRLDLKGHVRGPYQQFMFAYALSAEDAFEKQCELYHQGVYLENESHPRPPGGLNLPCPRCKVSWPVSRILGA